jgi:hypothetical protein
MRSSFLISSSRPPSSALELVGWRGLSGLKAEQPLRERLSRRKAEYALEKRIPHDDVKLFSQGTRMLPEKITPFLFSGCAGLKSVCLEIQIERDRANEPLQV